MQQLMEPIVSDSSPTKRQARAMGAIFELVDAVGENGLTVSDLSDVIRFAVADGHGDILIVMNMVIAALPDGDYTDAGPG